MNELSESEIKQLASQLRTPEGSAGIDVGHKMHETNINMTMTAVKALNLSDGDAILEIGHGNAAHLTRILNQAKNIHYAGLDISQTMQEEAQRINADLVGDGKASFHLYDGQQMPFEDNQFDKIMTTNTIYFWDRPVGLLNEAHRVIKPNGLFSICFAEKSFMKELPFAQYNFQLYSTEDVHDIVKQTSFEAVDTDTEVEQVKSKDGLNVDRLFTVVTLKKE
ncbi:class I SAM-dependent methyltransferase [Fodinibius salsisoli]|uniref:Class I SAM-dependent methyltransferase n=1 Tax=Fodinibius salsisoli TaxID=2820877 RepID=A0ABT3PRM3_9BACT|nr:class I SAM-dependent methyltransferase [Fodinibius salsisoli]MCW9708519.1 class I SAM-dependent methyltransferase [Fodinibius salsisoli]